MKKTININLGGIVFNIDDDAYIKLKAYLDQIEIYFSNENEGGEILADIENRIAELFQERSKGTGRVIDMKDVDEVIRILGDPEEIGGPENGQGEHQRKRYSSKTYRRIYRDPDNRVLGGVCSGISAYWRMDPLILRILFLVSFLGFGIGLIIYLILWIVIPEARTATQKLEMKGEPVNISNIGKTVKEEFNNVKNRMNL